MQNCTSKQILINKVTKSNIYNHTYTKTVIATILEPIYAVSNFALFIIKQYVTTVSKRLSIKTPSKWYVSSTTAVLDCSEIFSPINISDG